MAMRGKVAWGFISTAQINEKMIAGARLSDSVRLLAIASRDRERADAYARENGFERAYGSYDALLEDPDVEAVYISLPNSLHVEWSIRALEAGKHVLCEKPLTRRPEEAARAFDVAERAGRLLMEAFMYRHNPQTRRLEELVAAGSVGRAQLIRSAFSFPLHDQSNVRLNAELDGGSLMDLGCYCISGSRLLAGEPEQVFAEQVVGTAGVDVRVCATMRFSGDVVAQFDSGLSLANRDELEVVGDEGSLFLDDPWHCRAPVIEVRREDGVERIALEPVNSYMLELENLGAAVRGLAAPLLGRQDAVAQARVIEALYRSAEQGAVVAL
jgi:D-xylose 1-dehydrogenase (NADP+, D-xylono-1,5-lactone-forming)